MTELRDIVLGVLRPATRLGWKVSVSGLHNIPDDGPGIVAANHVSFMDSVFLPAVIPRRVTYVAKAEYLDSWRTRWMFPAFGMIPVDRAGGGAGGAALEAAADVLARGELFAIYPEGTRSRDGNLHRGHTGAARLALESGAPVLPVGISGTREILPPDARVPALRRQVAIRFGHPIDASERAASLADELRRMTDEVMTAIGRLSGQSYVDAYASKKSSRSTLDTQ